MNSNSPFEKSANNKQKKKKQVGEYIDYEEIEWFNEQIIN